ncbi:amidohydrolase [Prauserella marina]|uniref:Zn-dependent amino-or carboxypeptidase, M28 family n=1 Tax=Prauserella marina TaxID=530584 RepID=A0A222VJ60_9PSEU|nr:M28 family metallopeptidase [Prauserella marina]ASR33793.1 amidohydrolase [Prauserella marina]PWV82370.1 Zn-dependent M28 family amino/carboxypeptidase [Prauserella marina]SDC67530.1 Zn-dependent amino-or carboxypeptidase, M28 family [Prauserella marina]
MSSHGGRSRSAKSAVVLAACAGLVLTSAGTAVGAQQGSQGGLADKLARKVSVDNINRHLIAMQRIADVEGGRAASTNGHARSAEYIAGKLEAAGYSVTRQEFPFTYTETLAESLSVDGTDVPIIVMSYSPSTPEGGLTAPLAVVAPDDTPGCEAADYGDATGNIVLVQRGACSFAEKQAAAADAGAVGAIIYNNEEGDLNGTLGDPSAARIPTGGITMAAGQELAGQDGAEVNLDLRTFQEDRTSYNVIAETKTGRKDNVVMAGAHLDSVPHGPGINDNGTGSAALLETALQLGGKPKTSNAVRFAWWSAEEFGLVGSTHYVNSLSFEQQLDIALYLNFDMIGSPNAGYFVYDGDDSDGEGAGAGPYGSAQIEASFVDRLGALGIETEGTDFDGRSDYGEFIAVGIPAGGLFTGAEGLKTAEQAAKWGGQADVSYDPCYHQTCDNLGNVDRAALDRNADAMAWVTGKYATSTEEVNGVVPEKGKNRAKVADQRAAQRTLAAEHSHTDAA